MNWVDVVIIIVIALFGLNGYHKGFIRQLGDFLGLVFSVAVSFTLYNKLAAVLAGKLASFPMFLTKFIALAGLWVVSQIVFHIAFGLLYPLVPEKLRESKWNKGTGAIPGIAWGAIFVAITVSLLSLLSGFFANSKDYQKALSGSVITRTFIAQTNKIDNYFAKIVGGSIGENLTFKTVEPNSSERTQLGFKTANYTIDTESEAKMLVLVNAERAKNGEKPLTMDENLQKVARGHCSDMLIKGYFGHVSPDGKDPFARMKDANIAFIIAGENLALAPSVELAHDGLMNSPGHRANILTAEFGKVGIGVLDAGKYGKMFAQEFTN